MPASYTHYRFGKDVINSLSENCTTENNHILKIITQNRALFDTGLNGPDILFFYNALKTNAVNSLGHKMHNINASTFFINGKNTLKNMGDTAQKGLAYLLGFVCHYALDSECHSYIEHEIITNNLDHNAIEMCFDKILLKKDNIDYNKYNLATHIKDISNSATIIANFYPLSKQKISASLYSMKGYNGFLMPGSAIKSSFVNFALKVTGNSESLKGLFIATNFSKEYTNCADEFLRRYNGAIEIAIELIENYINFCTNEQKLSDRFSRNFGPYKPYMDYYKIKN